MHPSICYPYTLSPFTDEPVHVDWKVIVGDVIQSQHIRFYILQPEDKIKDLISSFTRTLAKAVVFVNTKDNYTLAPKFTDGMEKSSFPIIILTKSNGISLTEFLKKYCNQDILARLDTVSTVDSTPAQNQFELSQKKDVTLPIKIKSEATGTSM